MLSEMDLFNLRTLLVACGKQTGAMKENIRCVPASVGLVGAASRTALGYQATFHDTDLRRSANHK